MNDGVGMCRGVEHCIGLLVPDEYGDELEDDVTDEFEDDDVEGGSHGVCRGGVQ